MAKAFPRVGRRRALQGAGAAFVAVALLLWWLLPLGDEPPSGRITISTGTPLGVYQKYGTLLRSALKRDMPDLDVRLQVSSGSQINVTRLAAGTADFTIAAADAVETYRAESGPRAEDLRGVARLYDDYVHLVVASDSDVESVGDLRGKRVAIGLPNSGVRLIATQVLRTAGIDPEDDITPFYDGIDTGPQGLKEGRIDAFFWSGGLPTDGLKEFADDFAFRFVPLEADFVARLQRRGGATRYYRATTMPESAYPAIQHGTAVPTMAVSNLLVTRSDVDPRLTEWLTRTVIRSRDKIGSDVHSAQLVDLRTAIYTAPVPLHEGARRYYRSVKP